MTWMIGIVSAAIAFAVTPIVSSFAKKMNLVDSPSLNRKIHNKPTPLLGGVAIFVAITVVIGIVLWQTDLLTVGEVTHNHYFGIIVAGFILLIGGYIDDRYDLAPGWQLVAPIIAAIVAIIGGVGIEKITNPFGGALWLESQSYWLFQWPGDILVFLWLMGMMFTTKLLDGIDGLATGVGSVGAFMVLLLASSVAFFQPDVVVLSSIILGAFVGFMVWNVHPASIFLGEGGSLLIGFLLGSLAVISGGKIATLLLVMGIPILDAVWVIGRRLISGKRVTVGDRQHLHHRLFDFGLSQNNVVSFYAALALGFGALTLLLSSLAKLIALFVLLIFMIAAAVVLVEKKRGPIKRGPGKKSSTD
jgi:UDP-GlcNAc:undecaprenyl-phosphate/decaprenyl-phosphate GlcNAc-1-phosphate transferase